MLKQILLVARHELGVAIATRRAVAAALVFMVAAVLGGAGYAMTVRAVERHAIEVLIAQGASADEAARAVSVAGQEAYQSLVAALSGTTGGTPIAPSLTNSVIVPAFLWGSLAFLPFLVLLTSFDMASGELQSRSFCYSVLRAPRSTLLLGKLLAQTALFIGLTILSSLALLVVASLMLTSFHWAEALPGILRSWGLLLPYGFCYLGLSALCSVSTRQPAAALMGAIGVMIALRIAGLFGHIPPDAGLSVLRFLQWVSPAHYQTGLWEAGVRGPAFSATAYLLFGGVFTGLALRVLKERDL